MKAFLGLVIATLTFATSAIAQETSSTPVAEAKPTPRQDQAALAPEQGGMLSLTCLGGGSANKIDMVGNSGSVDIRGSFIDSGGITNFNASGSSQGTAYVPRAQSFADQLDLVIERGEGRVRVPRIMLPPVRGGENGWFKVKNLRFEGDAITASVAINVINNPKLHIDRKTGIINLSGKAGDFVGRCRKTESQAERRQF